jgi:Fe-S-cluster containining protein
MVVAAPDTPNQRHFAKERGFDILFTYRTAKDEKMLYMLIDSLCPHFTEEGLCDIYESRLVVCRKFPEDSGSEHVAHFCKLALQKTKIIKESV